MEECEKHGHVVLDVSHDLHVEVRGVVLKLPRFQRELQVVSDLGVLIEPAVEKRLGHGLLWDVLQQCDLLFP